MRHGSRNEVLMYRRAQQGLSQEELARAVHASRQTINAIENCRRQPNVGLAIAIASALEATVEELFGARSTERFWL